MSLTSTERPAETAGPGRTSGNPPSAVNGQPNSRPVAPATSPFLAFAARLWYSVLWCPCFAVSQIWFGYSYRGKANVPITGPVLMVSNHQSHLDPVLIGLACPRQLKYLARVGLFFWPFSWWIRALGAVPLNQESALGGIKTTLKLLKDGEAVVVFPEGSRTPDGQLHPLLPGFCVLARRSGATIVPTAIDGAFGALPRGASFPRPHLISLVFGLPITGEQSKQMGDEQLCELVFQRIRDGLARAPLGD